MNWKQKHFFSQWASAAAKLQNLLPHDHFWWYGGKGFQHSRRQQPHILLEWPLEGLFGKHVLLEKLIKMSKFLKAILHLNFVPKSFTPTYLNFKTEAVILPSTKYPEINTSRNTIMKSLIKQKRGLFSLNSYHKQNTHPQILGQFICFCLTSVPNSKALIIQNWLFWKW